MSKYYHEIMDKIKVTDEMNERILNNINQTPISSTLIPNRINYRKLFYIASCLIILIVSSLTLSNHLLVQKLSQNQSELTESPIMNCASVEELSKIVGLKITEPTNLPFKTYSTTYTAYFNELADITYTGNSQTATFRISKGNEDNSGDYNVYKKEKTIFHGKTAIKLKGNNKLYQLAIWTNNGYSYSLYFSTSISEDTFLEIISSIH